MTKKINVFAISDSLGETSYAIAQAASVQFPNTEFKIHRYPLIKTTSLLSGIMNKAKRENAIIVHTFVDPELSEFINSFCADNDLTVIDALSDVIQKFSQEANEKPLQKAGINHNTDKEYFNRIEALEFAVTYDDGKDPAGFLKADLVLLGISRTSKTPLSLFLANRGYKVANLPLVPKAQIPDEIYQVDPNKIFGLTNDPGILNEIRRERMIAYGLNPDTNYSNIDNIEDELNFANELYKKLGCPVINVAHKSIEETATLITESLESHDQK